MSGRLPDCIGQMRSLQSLGLHGNDLTGTLPRSLPIARAQRGLQQTVRNVAVLLGSLDDLELLGVHHNRFEGTIGPWTSGLPRLQACIARANFFSGTVPAQLVSLPLLKYLNLKDNHCSSPLWPT